MEHGESPWGIMAWEESGGTARDMPPVGATADIPRFCGHGKCTDSWSSSRRPQAETRPEWPACLTKLVTPVLLSASSSFCLVLCSRHSELGGDRERIVYPLLVHSEAQSRTNHAAGHQCQELGKGDFGREWPPPRARRSLAVWTALDTPGPTSSQGLARGRGQHYITKVGLLASLGLALLQPSSQ